MFRVPRLPGALVALGSGAMLLAGLGGCQLKHPVTNNVSGKQVFVAKCGACHTLSHAGTQGNVGPNLDDAFRQARADGMKTASIQGLVSYWIHYPNPQGGMPANVVKGQQAQNVAAYVAEVAAKPGQDTGALATAVQQTEQRAVAEKNGTLQIDADPTGQLRFLAASATASPGTVTLQMRNASSVPHDIGIRGAGIDKVGAVVQNGGTSKVTTALKPGTYTFYCSVDGHEAAGMKGTITVK